jgi:DNA gyrase/topoisomerase IV subunit A
LNLDKVIEIIREEDKPKEVLISFFKINEIQANAILDMRLRSLRKLEEIELKKELSNLQNELEAFKGILNDTDEQWKLIFSDIKDLKKEFKDIFKKADEVILCPIFSAGEKIKLGFNYYNFAKSITNNSKVKTYLVEDQFGLAKFINQNIYGKKIVINKFCQTKLILN